MTAKQLIVKLSQMPQDADVFIRGNDDTITTVTDVEHIDTLEDFPCQGYASSVKKRSFECQAVVIRSA